MFNMKILIACPFLSCLQIQSQLKPPTIQNPAKTAQKQEGFNGILPRFILVKIKNYQRMQIILKATVVKNTKC